MSQICTFNATVVASLAWLLFFCPEKHIISLPWKFTNLLNFHKFCDTGCMGAWPSSQTPVSKCRCNAVMNADTKLFYADVLGPFHKLKLFQNSTYFRHAVWCKCSQCSDHLQSLFPCKKQVERTRSPDTCSLCNTPYIWDKQTTKSVKMAKIRSWPNVTRRSFF